MREAMRCGVWVLPMVFCVVLWGCKGEGKAPPTPPPGVGKASAPLSDAQALQLYVRACASCHGVGGKGDGPRGRRLSGLPDFTTADFQNTRNDAAIRTVIQEGLGRMPGFKQRFGQHELDALIKMVRSKKE